MGHATDRATILGLAGFEPATYDAAKAEATLDDIKARKVIDVPGLGELVFDPGRDLVFDYGPALPGHANGMILRATDAQGDVILQETYYSIGGGFVLTADELADAGSGKAKARADVPYPFEKADEMLAMAKTSGLTIAQMKRANELKFRSAADLDRGMERIWQVMNDCISRGMEGTGILPGGLKVRRRAKGIHDALMAERGLNMTPPHVINDWMSLLCDGGERGKRRWRASGDRADQWGGGRGACGDPLLAGPCAGGVCLEGRGIHADGGGDWRLGEAQRQHFRRGNAAVRPRWGLPRRWRRRGLCAVLGGTPEQVENAAEIALEHHLGMTCDPVKGLVQVPCIERNGFGGRSRRCVGGVPRAARGWHPSGQP